MSTCCLPFSIHEGTPIGEMKEVFGLDSYVVGDMTSKKVIILICDIYGPKFKNLQLIADYFSKEGYLAIAPDFLTGDYLEPNWDMAALGKFLGNHNSEITKPLVVSYLTKLREELNPTFLGSIGYCWGAKYTLQQLDAEGLLDAGCIAHPSVTVEEEYLLIAKPLLISAAETDPIFPPELRHKAEALALATGIPFQSTLFQGVSHGFAVKGDYSIEAVNYAAHKALKDHIDWFKRFAK